MDRKEVIRKYEQKCYNYLKLRFEDVYWKSLNRPLTKYDFVCYNNNLVFTVDAKKVINNNIVITKNQFNCSLFIIEIDNNFILCSLRTLIKDFGFNICVSNDEKIKRIINKIHKSKKVEPSINLLTPKK